MKPCLTVGGISAPDASLSFSPTPSVCVAESVLYAPAARCRNEAPKLSGIRPFFPGEGQQCALAGVPLKNEIFSRPNASRLRRGA